MVTLSSLVTVYDDKISKLTCESVHHLWATQGLLTGKKMWSPLYSGTNMQYMQAPVK